MHRPLYFIAAFLLLFMELQLRVEAAWHSYNEKKKKKKKESKKKGGIKKKKEEEEKKKEGLSCILIKPAKLMYRPGGGHQDQDKTNTGTDDGDDHAQV